MSALPAAALTEQTAPIEQTGLSEQTALSEQTGLSEQALSNEHTAPSEPAAAPARSRRRSRVTGPSQPLGSLTQREHRATTECLSCGSTRVTRLSLNLTDGTPVEFTSCHRCEHRSWEHAGDPLSMDVVLDRTRRV